MIVTIGMKAFNEEKHIASALSSAVKAVQPFGGEVVLADSGSTDRTVDIAKDFPVRIVQLANPSERSCGAGAQLAFQHARGTYFYLMDGDMVIEPDFLPAAIAFLDAHPEIAGVGGEVRDVNVSNQEFAIRANEMRKDEAWRPGIVDRLDCGGLYRMSALQEIGYFADRNLHAFEEFDLAARLQSRGWRLARIDRLAVHHYGHRTDGYKLLWRRIRTGYSGGAGEVLRGAVGHGHLPIVLRRLGHVRNGLAVIAWWGLLLSSPFWMLPAVAKAGLLLALLIGPVAALALRRSSLNLGVYSFVSWNALALGLVTGFLRKRVSPEQPLAALILREPSPRQIRLSA
ncbi:glycosyltransferase family 2 protein [Microvirga sesbaniae]|uniref:glycosyltransferase family 2 protein n=1 Tax=Microvirga sesbaniae TaxID=681392 RepID=UPI0021C8F2C8|nr:glycosyltransferase [Microvirga sp. HBU67692]